jgi:hypothetical protein
VDNGVSLLSVEDEAGLLRARLRSAAGGETVWARKLVLALGREGSGAPRWPSFPSLRREDPLAAGRVFHSADAIDFEALRGRRIGVLGAALRPSTTPPAHWKRAQRGPVRAPAAAAAGEQEQVDLVPGLLPRLRGARRPAQVAPSTPTSSTSRCRRPWETVRRCDAHAGFGLRLGTPWTDVQPQADGVLVHTPQGSERFDAVIFGTGFDVDLLERPELARYAGAIDTWARHVGRSRRPAIRRRRASPTWAPASSCARAARRSARRSRTCTCSTGAAP